MVKFKCRRPSEIIDANREQAFNALTKMLYVRVEYACNKPCTTLHKKFLERIIIVHADQFHEFGMGVANLTIEEEWNIYIHSEQFRKFDQDMRENGWSVNPDVENRTDDSESIVVIQLRP